MPEGLSTSAGQPIDLDAAEQQFAAAMAAPEPGQRPDYPPPAHRDDAAPHGRDAQGNPLAPFGFKNGTNIPRRTVAGPGRSPKAGSNDAPRVQKAGRDVAPKPKTALDPAELSARRAADATTTLELLAAGGSLLAMIGSARAQAAFTKAKATGNEARQKLAVIASGKAEVMQLDAAACAIHADTVGPAVAGIAASNPLAAALVDRLSLFNGVASVGIAVMPLVYQVIANHAPAEVRDDMPPGLLALGVMPPNMLLEKLQAQNAVKMANAQAEILAEKHEAEARLAELRDEAA